MKNVCNHEQAIFNGFLSCVTTLQPSDSGSYKRYKCYKSAVAVMCVVAIYDTIDSRYIAIIYKLSIYRVMYDTIVHNKSINTLHWLNIGHMCTHERHPTPHPYGRAMGCLSWDVNKNDRDISRVSTNLIGTVRDIVPANTPCGYGVQNELNMTETRTQKWHRMRVTMVHFHHKNCKLVNTTTNHSSFGASVRVSSLISLVQTALTQATVI